MFVIKVVGEDRYAYASETTTHTGTHHTFKLVYDINAATLFRGPLNPALRRTLEKLAVPVVHVQATRTIRPIEEKPDRVIVSGLPYDVTFSRGKDEVTIDGHTHNMHVWWKMVSGTRERSGVPAELDYLRPFFLTYSDAIHNIWCEL